MKIIGHRGARGLAPENTLAGLKKALEVGVDLIEFDVRVSADNIPVVCHDSAVLNDKHDKFLIDSSVLAELRAHKPELATLEEALTLVNGAVPLYIEVKQGVETEPVVELLKSYKHKYLLGSKSQRILVKLHQQLPDVPLIIIETWSGVRASRRARQVNTKILSMYQLFLWSGFIRAMKRSGYELYAYTINDPAKAKRWAKHGLAGVVTDYPDRFKN